MLKALVVGASLVLTLAACATLSPTREVARTASLAPAAAPQHCVPATTATRIPVKSEQCVGFGQTYSQEQIQQTGQIELGPALRILDPSLTVHGH